MPYILETCSPKCRRNGVMTYVAADTDESKCTTCDACGKTKWLYDSRVAAGVIYVIERDHPDILFDAVQKLREIVSPERK